MIGFRRILSSTPTRLALSKSYGTGSQLVDVTVDDQTGISTVSMASAPVNSLNRKLLGALRASLEDVQNNRSRGVILTSSLPTVFSAGLDIMEMYDKDEANLKDFWSTLQDTWLTLYGLEIPVAAAINGASPAGGCLLAISTEYRVMVDGKHRIGLNETQLGILAPKWFRDVYVSTIGYRAAELALMRGALFTPSEALKVNLVDELASDKADAIKKCQDYIASFKKIHPQARAVTKLEMRKRQLEWLQEHREEDVMYFAQFVQLPQVQAGLKMYIEALRQKQK